MIDGFGAPTTVPRPIPYHNGPGRASQVPLKDRPFVAWDGEGANLDGPGKPQAYILFGSSDERVPPLLKSGHLHFFECLDYIIRVGRLNPTAFHISYSFNYDVVQIIRTLPEAVLVQLHKTGKLRISRPTTGDEYFVHYIPSKWFSVTKFGDTYDRKRNPTAKVTVRIYDIFSFFATSFVKAYETTTGNKVSDIVASGKRARDDFANLDLAYVERYWRMEILQLRELAEALRDNLYGAGFYIREWHGPGALASFINKTYNVRSAMAKSPDEVREAARYGYAGGRFEIFQLGRREGPIYSLDINSAYPYAISQLPNLSVGVWERVDKPTRVARFGIYRVRLVPRRGGSFVELRPGPLFHRDKMGNISFPWVTEGWYWSPEVANLVKHLPRSQYEILEGWEYTGWSEKPPPFDFINGMYTKRRKWKEEGNASQLALKLGMNSLYGKMAQRVGWNEEKKTAPSWHQLEWAGWVTSYCRAMLWDAMQRIPRRSLIAVETDGLYTTHNPAEILGPEYGYRPGSGGAKGSYFSSTELGGWEVEEYDEIIYVQSGLAWLRIGEKWKAKRRGLDAKTFQLDDAQTYVASLRAGERWSPFVGSSHRFIGLGGALVSSTPTHERLGLWVDIDRDISPGMSGKRFHIPKQCEACGQGLTAYESTHDLSIRSLAYKPGERLSKPHDIPWEGEVMGYKWRNRAEEDGYLTDATV